MENNDIYQLPRVPIRSVTHKAVQRQIILTTVLVDKSSDHEIEKTIKILDNLRDSVTIQMLPLYINSNISLPESWGQYTEVHTDSTIENSLISRWQLAFQFLKVHSEIEQAALIYPDASLCNNPFQHLNPSKLYVGDEAVDLSHAGFFSKEIPSVEKFWQLNPRLQLLNPGVIVGCRTPLLEIMSAMLIFIKDHLTEEMQANFNVYNEREIFNYLMYRYFAQRMVHGRKVTTIYGFQQQKTRSWFKYH